MKRIEYLGYFDTEYFSPRWGTYAADKLCYITRYVATFKAKSITSAVERVRLVRNS
jgi:hypothetical protein